MFDSIAEIIPYQKINLDSPLHLTVKRLDMIHPEISGNKFYKLKYNLQKAKKLEAHCLITFGGAYSNHIAATAYAAHLFGFQSIGIIRGEELIHQPLNHTLATAQKFGMTFDFVSREKYRQRNDPIFLEQLKTTYPESYIIPEGGTNHLAIQGCKEILTSQDQLDYDYICCAVGTGGTISGIIEASNERQKILGFSALKGNFQKYDVQRWTQKINWNITDDYCFGGYAKFSAELHQFIGDFEDLYHIPLDPVYTGKMMYGIMDLISKNYFPKHSRILIIHSGGLQGKISR
ncbi:1-aminocyclopropane-1-carboxylate deaminase/D-cysteine desulfhydrase [Acinetobacter stercoris]|uniref:D-cysteine desulfhydrase n=1 Tax=Acinetobacter stercoris TaxID=2126983 RepID=A0A2U3MUA7_9GAMM|nr:pyridoxal-phosphate dependent enzyme [Acinetobacter stercoris]SPL68992.1 D-cysteine desulfhydrase [Acinetobacter stercoris]